jgi:hypothetical protein
MGYIRHTNEIRHRIFAKCVTFPLSEPNHTAGRGLTLRVEVSIMSINKAIVVGNLCRDPEVRALPSGQNVAMQIMPKSA